MHDINTFFRNLKNDSESFQRCSYCGCIPTCVRNLLKFYGIKNPKGNDWSQKDVMDYFNTRVPSQNFQCQKCWQIFNEKPTFRIMKEFENYQSFGDQYKVRICPDEDEEIIKEEILDSVERLRDYLLKKLIEVVMGDSTSPALVSIMPRELSNSHICIVTEISNHEVWLFDPGKEKGLLKISKEQFNDSLNLRNKSDYSRICYIYDIFS